MRARRPRPFVPRPETIVAARAAAEKLGIADWLFGPDPEPDPPPSPPPSPRPR